MVPADLASDLIGGFLKDVVDDAWVNLVKLMYAGSIQAIQFMGTWWLAIPAPVLETADGSPAQRIMFFTRALVPVIGVFATIFAIVRMGLFKDRESTLNGVFGLVRVIFFSGAALGGITLALSFGDLFAPWFVEQMAGEPVNEAMAGLSGNQEEVLKIVSSNSAMLIILLIIFLIALLGGLLNLVFAFFGFAMLPILAGILPMLAAASVTEKGNRNLSKVLAWIVSIILFKPVAAVIYGGGLAGIKALTSATGQSLAADQVLIQTIAGGVVLACAGLSLPALMRTIVPAMAAGPRGAGGAGALMAAGAVAAGAVSGGASLLAKGAASRAAAAGTGAARATGTAQGAAGTAGARVNRGLVRSSQAGTAGGGAGHNPSSRGPGNAYQPTTRGPGGPPPVPSRGSVAGGRAGSRRMDSAKQHLSNQLYRAEDAMESGENL